MYRPDSQCCSLRHWPYGQCRFFPFFLVLVAWANCGFRVNYGQCRFCTAIGPEVANAAPLLPRGCPEWMLQYHQRHWPTLLNCTSREYFPTLFSYCDQTAPYVQRHHMCNGTIRAAFNSFINFAREECLIKLLASTLCCQIWVDNWFLILSQYPATNKLFPLNMNTYANELLHIFGTQG